MLPTAYGTFYAAAPKPKQDKTGQDDLSICPQIIEPPGSIISCAAQEPKQVWAELDGLASTAGI